jgi:two-component system, LuxR family, sensor kinase FixL
VAGIEDLPDQTMTEPASTSLNDVRSRLAAIVESSDDPIISKDLRGIVTSWNRAAERLFGYRAGEMIGQPITTIFPLDRIDEEATFLSRVARGEQVEHYETVRRHKDGHAISVSVTISPIRDTHGSIIGASKIIHDLTERDARERRIQELQTELAHVQRLTELGQIVSALVHEVNQPLTAIGNYVSACRRLLTAEKPEQVQKALQQVARQTDRAFQIVQRIRDFVKKGNGQVRAEALPQAIEEILLLTQASVRQEGLRVTTELDPAARLAEIDKVRVQQVLFNLMRNSIEAMQGQRKRELSVTTRSADDDMVEISVADIGPGLPNEVREKLFQPFVTTKANGMGVGLSVCHAIVEAHGGRLWVEENPAGGTVFRFTVRRARA